MPRNSQGLYTLPPSNPVAPNTLIEADWANATMEDIGEALTESLPRDGSAPMTGPLILRTGNPTQPREAVSKAYMEQFIAYATGMPVGAVFAFASGATPPGYLLCNGQAVSRTTYATLFTAIGVVYGNGDGTTTFNVPDLRNEFVRGKTDTRPLGNKQEASLASHIHPVVDPTHTHAATQAAHSHSISTGGHNHGISDPGHAHNYYKGGTVAGSQYTAGVGWINNYEASGAAQTGISIAAVGDLGGSTNSVTPDVAVSAVASGVTVGAAGGDETRPQNIALDYYIKAMSDTSGPVTLTGIETSDANMIAIDNTNPIVPLLFIQSNVAFGIPKLDSTGKLGLAQMPTSSAQFLGYFDASPGALPDTAGITSGDYYAVSVQGTLTVYDPVTLTAAPTLVVVGSQLHYVSGSVSNPTGWYVLTVSGATLASDIQFIPGGTLNGTNVQAAISELDSETQTALGGKAPSAAATGAGTSFPPSGSISASNVTAAIQELDTETVKLTGGTMTGNLTGTNFLAPKHQVGVSATPANNFTLDASADNGTMKIARNSGQDVMTVDAAGKVAFPQNKVPVFRASLGATQSFVSGTPTKVVQDTIEFNPTIDFANGRWTPQVAGYYQVSACNQMLTNAQGTYGYLELRKSGAAVARQEATYVGNVATNYGTLNVSGLVYLNGTTDYVEAWVLAVSTNPYTGGSAALNNFSGSLVRQA